MMLNELIQDLAIAPLPHVEISGITQDSRKVRKGFLFVAIPGHERDGHDFLSEAIQKGAAAVVISHPSETSLAVPRLVVPDPRQALARLAARFYGEPSLKMRVIGVTGTNGKTTLTYLLESILKKAGRRPAVIGTIDARYEGKTFPSRNTTPESVDLQELISRMTSQGVTDLVMEVSSHALAMGRVREIHFDLGVFTNLSQDHLDFHKDLEDYFQSKLRLFTEFLPQSRKGEKYAVLNMEDSRSESIDRALANGSIPAIRVGLTGPYEVSCRSFELSDRGITAEVGLESGSLQIESGLLGRFNLENILLAVGTAHSLGIENDAIVEGIRAVKTVPGRLERIPNDRGLQIFVDYAHTPRALARVGENLRRLTRGRLITVFGCGGDRDRSKRPLMGREAALFSDLVIVTSDNPRSENPEAILSEILPGLREVGYPEKNVFRIASREEALKKALELARENDLILVAGKGHEDYQIVGDKRIPFSDREVLKRLLKRGYPPPLEGGGQGEGDHEVNDR